MRQVVDKIGQVANNHHRISAGKDLAVEEPDAE